VDGFLGTCGGRGGGNGLWRWSLDDPCQLEVVADGLASIASEIQSLMTGSFSVGLYSNDRFPLLDDTIANYVPCTFTGYDGLHLLYFIASPQMVGVKVRLTALVQVWERTAGPISNDVFGYYVVDGSGALQFAERFCNGPFPMNVPGRKFNLTVTFTVRNERQDS